MNSNRNKTLIIGFLLMSTLACISSADRTAPTQPATQDDREQLANIPQPARTIDTACSNEYYPVVLGASWKYEVNLDQPTGEDRTNYERLEIVDVSPDEFQVNVGTSSEPSAPADGFTPMIWHCSSDGLLTADELQMGFEGVTIAKDMSVGSVWTKTETATGYVLTYKSLSQETISVQAGTFDTIKVSEEDGRGQNSYFTWYSMGVGVIKVIYETQGLTISRELISYSIP